MSVESIVMSTMIHRAEMNHKEIKEVFDLKETLEQRQEDAGKDYQELAEYFSDLLKNPRLSTIQYFKDNVDIDQMAVILGFVDCFVVITIKEPEEEYKLPIINIEIDRDRYNGTPEDFLDLMKLIMSMSDGFYTIQIQFASWRFLKFDFDGSPFLVHASSAYKPSDEKFASMLEMFVKG